MKHQTKDQTKHNRLLPIISLVILAILILFLAYSCKKAETPKAEPVVPVEVPTELPSAANITSQPAKTPEAINDEEIREEVELKSNASESFSGLRCDDYGIQGWVTNIDNETKILGKTVKIVVNGKAVFPPECEKLSLQPGESTYCKDLSGPYDYRKGTNKLVFNFKTRGIVDVVDCIGPNSTG